MTLGVLVLLALGGAGLVAGFVDAIAGGGGLIALPALLAVGIPPVVALGTNKVQSVIGTGIAALTYWRGGYVSFAAIDLAAGADLCGCVRRRLRRQADRCDVAGESSFRLRWSWSRSISCSRQS